MFAVIILCVAVAMVNEDGSELVVRIVNWGATYTANINLLNVIAPTTMEVTMLEGVTSDDAEQVCGRVRGGVASGRLQNTPLNPTEVSPRSHTTACSGSTPVTLPGNSFTVLTFSGLVSSAPKKA
jgi:hypothetical protein